MAGNVAVKVAQIGGWARLFCHAALLSEIPCSVLSAGKTWTCWSQCRGGHESAQRGEPFCEDMLRELEKKRLWVDLIAAFKYLKRAYKKAEEKFFSRACCNRMRDNGFN